MKLIDGLLLFGFNIFLSLLLDNPFFEFLGLLLCIIVFLLFLLDFLLCILDLLFGCSYFVFPVLDFLLVRVSPALFIFFLVKSFLGIFEFLLHLRSFLVCFLLLLKFLVSSLLSILGKLFYMAE